MLIKDNAGVETGQILNPDGSVANRPTTTFTPEEAGLLRAYKKFLAAHHLREALYCDDCWDGTREDGCKAFVTTDQIGIICRCKMRVFLGMTI